MNMNKNAIKLLLNWRSVILIVVLYNFFLIWNIASNWSLSCMLCPWYTTWSFYNSPSLILLAACGLRLGRRLGYFIAVVASGVVLVEGVVLNIQLIRDHEMLESWGILVWSGMNPFLSLHTQYLFALIVLITAAYFATVRLRHTGN